MDILKIKSIKSKEAVREIAISINSKQKMAKFVDLVSNDDEIIASKSSWIISHCVDLKNPLLLDFQCDFGEILKTTSYKAVKRNLLRVFIFNKIDDDVLGSILDKLFEFILNPKEAIATRAFSLAILEKAYKRYPDLGTEIKEACNIALIDASSGLKSRCLKTIKLVSLNS